MVQEVRAELVGETPAPLGRLHPSDLPGADPAQPGSEAVRCDRRRTVGPAWRLRAQFVIWRAPTRHSADAD